MTELFSQEGPDADHRREVALLDPGPWGGHSRSYTKRLIEQFKSRGYWVLLVASGEHATQADEHLVLEPGQPVHDRLDAVGEDLHVVDLDYARTLRSYGGRRGGDRPMTHVLHGVGQVRLIAPRERWRPRSRVRVAHFLRRCRQDVERGHRIIVHTDIAHRHLARSRVPTVLEPLPVLLSGRSEVTTEPKEHYLFIGGTSASKGFATGLSALLDQAAHPVSRVVVVGCQGETLEREGSLQVDYRTGVSQDQLWRLYRNAQIVMLPYSRAYELTGAASLVLQEALYAGCRVVAGPWAREQTQSPNVVIANSYQVDDLAEAVDCALAATAPAQPQTTEPELYLRALLNAGARSVRLDRTLDPGPDVDLRRSEAKDRRRHDRPTASGTDPGMA